MDINSKMTKDILASFKRIKTIDQASFKFAIEFIKCQMVLNNKLWKKGIWENDF